MNYWLTLLTLLMLTAEAAAQGISGITAGVRHHDYERFNRIVQDYKEEFFHVRFDDCLKVKRLLRTDNGEWEMGISGSRNSVYPDAYDYRVTMRLLAGREEEASAYVSLVFDSWDRSGYLLLPSAAYNGNRFDWRRIRYSPKLNDNRDISPDCPVIISDVPRLSIGEGPSIITDRAGALAFPFVGMECGGTVGAVAFSPSNSFGDLGFSFEEGRSGGALLTFQSPVVRESYKYEITDNMAPSSDRPATFVAGDSVVFEFTLHKERTGDLKALYDLFFMTRMLESTDMVAPRYAFSECYKMIEDKFNRQNFVPEYGYYSVGMRENFLQDWQIGWTGGMITTYPLLFSDNPETIGHVIANFDWLFPQGISPSGFFWDSGANGTEWYGGDIRREQTANWHLIRKSGDALFYILRQFQLMKERGIDVKPEWGEGARRVADSFVELFNRYGQFGQFVDSRTGQIIVGGSTSGAIVPAALTEAYIYYSEPAFLKTALESAEKMYRDYISVGISCGGPGDAMQNPDSESWYAMLESFMTLYETTSDPLWLQRAEETARQFATWVMSYNYSFPEESLFGSLGMETTGAVFANTQNKHGSPGICTHSGIALLRLYRASGDKRYARLLSQISRCIPSYMSHPDRPVAGMPPGWINERVSTTDWFEGIGEINPGSTWAETAMLLTAVELPSVYVDLETGNSFTFDHLEAVLRKDGVLEITNPTKYNASAKVVFENKENKTNRWDGTKMYSVKTYHVSPGQTISVKE